MVRAYHVILTAYGFWLPNDPRGSWSHFVHSWELRRFGPATKVDTRRSVASRPHDRAARLAGKEALNRRPVVFTGAQALAIGSGFADYSRRTGCVIHAASILPTHVHLVVGRHRCAIEKVMELLKGAATTRLMHTGVHPFQQSPYRNGRLPSAWTRHGWCVYLSTDEDVRRAIWYVENNPVKEGKRAQRWSFVASYVGG